MLIVNNESQPLVKLVDFGISMLAGVDDQIGGSDGQAGAGMLVGTPMYLAPELYEGSRQARAPSDIFSLGVIGYELLSREMPFSQPPVVTRFRQEPLQIPSLRERCSTLPPPLLELIDGCLHGDSAQRPTAEQIVKILNNL